MGTSTDSSPSPLLAPPRREVGPITRTDIVKFAGAGGDFNPVHHDEEFARRAGHPSVFAMGMLTAGLLGDFVADWLGLAQVARFNVRFVRPVWPGDVLALAALDVGGDAEVAAAKLRVAAGSHPCVTGEVATRAARGGVDLQPPHTPDDLRYLLETPPQIIILPVERGKVMEFARAIKSDNPLHYDAAAAKAAGFNDVVAPLTFSAVAAHYTGGDAADLPKSLGLDISRMLHGEERWSFERPPVAGETLTGTRTVAAAWRKETKSGGVMTFVLVAVDYRDADGASVLRDEMLMIEMPPRPPSS